MTMLALLEDLNKKYQGLEKLIAIYIFNYLKGFSTNVSKNDLGSLDKIAVTSLEGNVCLKICTEDLEKIKL